jgi:putative FmdB family regulatory protein
MPTYEYVCTKCGPFDVFQSMSDAPLSSCPTCGDPVKRKINGGMGVIFKGSGFYKNDSRKASSAASPASPASGSASKGASGCESCAAAPSCDSPAKDAV